MRFRGNINGGLTASSTRVHSHEVSSKSEKVYNSKGATSMQETSKLVAGVDHSVTGRCWRALWSVKI